jgi:hypothetical protein
MSNNLILNAQIFNSNPSLALSAVEFAYAKQPVEQEVKNAMINDLANSMIKVEKNIEKTEVLTAEELQAKMKGIKFFTKPKEITDLRQSVQNLRKADHHILTAAFAVTILALVTIPFPMISIAFAVLAGVLYLFVHGGVSTTALIKNKQYNKEIDKAAELVVQFKRSLKEQKGNILKVLVAASYNESDVQASLQKAQERTNESIYWLASAAYAFQNPRLA